LSPSLKQVLKEFENDLLRHLGKDISLLKALFNGDNFDFLLNDLLVKPDGFDGIVFAARSKLRRWGSCMNQSAQLVLIVLELGSLSSGFLIPTATPISPTRAMMGKSSWQQLPKAIISASMVEVAVSV
jgi:hypothetical protein